MLTARLRHSIPPYRPLLQLHRSSSALELQNSIPPRQCARSPPPILRTSIPPRYYTFHRASRAPILHSSFLHISTPHRASRPLYLHISTSAQSGIHLRHSIPLYTSIPPYFHVATPAARLQSYRAPELHISVPCTPAARLQRSRTAYIHTSTSLHLHRASRPPSIL